MKYSLKLIILLITPTIFLASCEDDNTNSEDCIRGVGEIVSETRTLPAFDAISSSVVGNVFIIQGTSHEVRIETNGNILPVVSTEVESNSLIIETTECINNTDRMDFFVTTPTLDLLVFSGVGNVSTPNEITFEDLHVNMSGVGTVTLLGQVPQFNCIMSGIGDLNAYDLICDEADLHLSGIGSMRVTVNDRLNATISGTGDIIYKGDPNVTASISGTGSIRKGD